MNTDSHARPDAYRSSPHGRPSLALVGAASTHKDPIWTLRRDLRARIRDTEASATALQAQSSTDVATALWEEAEQLSRVLRQYERLLSEAGHSLPPMEPPRGALACAQMRSVGGLLELHAFRNMELRDLMLEVAALPGWPDPVARWFESRADQIDARNRAYAERVWPPTPSDLPSFSGIAATVLLVGLLAMGAGGVAAAVAAAALYEGSVLAAAGLGAVMGAISGLLIAGIVAGIPIASRARRETREESSVLLDTDDLFDDDDLFDTHDRLDTNGGSH